MENMTQAGLRLEGKKTLNGDNIDGTSSTYYSVCGGNCYGTCSVIKYNLYEMAGQVIKSPMMYDHIFQHLCKMW